MRRSCRFTEPGGRSAAADFQVVYREEEDGDTLLLAASQQFEKRCGLLMNGQDAQSAALAQVPANTVCAAVQGAQTSFSFSGNIQASLSTFKPRIRSSGS